MEVLKAANERAAGGADVLHLEVGEPSTGAPHAVVSAAAALLGTTHLGYTEALGIPPLRAAIARHYKTLYGIELDPARVVVTAGSSGGFVLSFLAAFEAGDRIALAAPGYPAYTNILTALGLEPVMLPSEAEHRFQPTPELLDRVQGRIDGLLVASPANPTGTMIDDRSLKRLVDYCRERGTRFISDEIYHGITYDRPAQSVLAYTNDAIVINSFSKYFCMTGWRLGWMVVPSDLLRSTECLAQNVFISPTALSQHAALAAFDCRPDFEANVARYAKNREILLREMPRAGICRFAPPDGAFYLYGDVGDYTDDSIEFCRRMLTEIGVAATPGIDFDKERGHRFVRFCFAGTTAVTSEAARRIAAWLNR
ncbi:MAG: aminotransferase class I/II-fold pyridoxal phosphate-dependent enzyme [Alphaproteobacteria bacterium]|nr:aminotransferase class I/II-fold pyridoxal phosphate-dependent enzyme [Alphaproteobacteria bacterium]